MLAKLENWNEGFHCSGDDQEKLNATMPTELRNGVTLYSEEKLQSFPTLDSDRNVLINRLFSTWRPCYRHLQILCVLISHLTDEFLY